MLYAPYLMGDYFLRGRRTPIERVPRASHVYAYIVISISTVRVSCSCFSLLSQLYSIPKTETTAAVWYLFTLSTPELFSATGHSTTTPILSLQVQVSKLLKMIITSIHTRNFASCSLIDWPVILCPLITSMQSICKVSLIDTCCNLLTTFL